MCVFLMSRETVFYTLFTSTGKRSKTGKPFATPCHNSQGIVRALYTGGIYEGNSIRNLVGTNFMIRGATCWYNNPPHSPRDMPLVCTIRAEDDDVHDSPMTYRIGISSTMSL